MMRSLRNAKKSGEGRTKMIQLLSNAELYITVTALFWVRLLLLQCLLADATIYDLFLQKYAERQEIDGRRDGKGDSLP